MQPTHSEFLIDQIRHNYEEQEKRILAAMTPSEPRRTIIVQSDRPDIDDLIAKMEPLGIDIIAQPTAPVTAQLQRLGAAMERSAAQLKRFAKKLPSLDEVEAQTVRQQQATTLKERRKLLAKKKKQSKLVQVDVPLPSTLYHPIKTYVTGKPETTDQYIQESAEFDDYDNPDIQPG